MVALRREKAGISHAPRLTRETGLNPPVLVLLGVGERLAQGFHYETNPDAGSLIAGGEGSPSLPWPEAVLEASLR